MQSLYIITPDGEISTFPLDKDRIRIGRSRENDLVLTDGTVSRHHAEIIKGKDGFRILDLGSYNKTQLNGMSLEESAPLEQGDKIQVGLTKLSFLMDSTTPDRFGDSLVLSADAWEDRDGSAVLESSSEISLGDSLELLAPAKEARASAEAEIRPEAQLSALERSNKVLFVLYEISRHMSQIHEFDELLKKIMDLIFVVIDADYGFLILGSGIRKDELIPVVVKHKEASDGRRREIKASRTLIKRVIHDKVALLTSNAMADSRLDGSKSVIMQQIRSAICVPLWRKERIIGVIQLDSLRLDNQFSEDDLELLKAIGSQVALVIEQAALNQRIREEERMRNRLERFHSPQVIEMILKGGPEAKDDVMEPKELTATILFTDIVGFTRLSETMPPREINVLLNRHFSRLTDIVFEYDGTLDKYVGDGLMAVFGAPMEKEDDAERATYAALEIMRQFSTMMQATSREKRFEMRIGINTGRVVAGNMGSPKRMEYTVIGDPVNIAARLESIAAPNQILIGHETYKRVKGKFEIRTVGARKVRGKTEEVMVYEVIA